MLLNEEEDMPLLHSHLSLSIMFPHRQVDDFNRSDGTNMC